MVHVAIVLCVYWCWYIYIANAMFVCSELNVYSQLNSDQLESAPRFRHHYNTIVCKQQLRNDYSRSGNRKVIFVRKK